MLTADIYWAGTMLSALSALSYATLEQTYVIDIII